LGARSLLRLALPVLAVGLLLSTIMARPAAAQLPALGNAEDDARQGAEAHPQILAEFGGAYDDPKLQAYVNGVGQRLAAVSDRKEVKYTFTILNSPIVNAFALPGGYVYISRGLLAYATDEAELSGVLGHEIGHVVARHQAQRQTGELLGTLGSLLLGAVLNSPDIAQVGQAVAGAGLASYSREQEYEADDFGVKYLSRIGLDPYAQSDFLLTLLNETALSDKIAGQEGRSNGFNFMASHPNTADRVKRAYNLAEQTGAKPGQLPRYRDRLIDAVDGMIYDDDPSQGVVRERTFIHPDLRIAFTVPEGFEMQNSPKAVTARDKGGGFVVFDGGKVQPGIRMTDYLAQGWVKDAAISDLQPINVNGMEAATGIAQASANGNPVLVRLVAIRAASDQVYRFMMGAPSDRMRQYDPAFQSTAQSLRRISASEAASVRPKRIRIVTVRPGDTVQSLAAKLPFQNFKEERFRLLNALGSDEALRPGVRVKMVVQE
jgi:predicted Zn-dependent protease